MIDRRILLASTAGLLGFAVLRWLRGEPASTSITMRLVVPGARSTGAR